MSYYRTALVLSTWNCRDHRDALDTKFMHTKDSDVSVAIIITQMGQSPLYRRDLLHASYLESNAMSMEQRKE
jgi:hypothetical protein